MREQSAGAEGLGEGTGLYTGFLYRKKIYVLALWMLMILKPEETSAFVIFANDMFHIHKASKHQEISNLGSFKSFYFMEVLSLKKNMSLDTILKGVCLFPLADPGSVGWDSALEPEALPAGQPPEGVQFRNR